MTRSEQRKINVQDALHALKVNPTPHRDSTTPRPKLTANPTPKFLERESKKHHQRLAELDKLMLNLRKAITRWERDLR